MGLLLTVLPIVLMGLWLLAYPLYLAWHRRAALSFGWAAGFVVLGLGVAALLTPLLGLGLEVLLTVLPALNPYPVPAFEPVDAGLFALWLGLTLALALACLIQARLLRARIRAVGQKAAP